MPRKLLYIVNPVSGTSSKERIRQLISRETEKAGFPFQFFPSVADGNYQFLFDTIINEKFTDIIIVGGDGTVSQVVDQLKHLPVEFGIIPRGSGNGLAYGAGIPSGIKKALQTVFTGKSRLTDGFRINRKFACMLCGLGFDGKVAHEFSRQAQRGLATYIKVSVKNFWSARPYRFNIGLATKNFDIEAYFISIANSNQFGNNFTIAPHADLSDGLLDIVIVTEQSKLEMLYNTVMQITGLNPLKTQKQIRNHRGIIYFQASEIIIGNTGLAPMHIDGEPVVSDLRVHAEIEEKCFKLIS
ncbi:diacylglycerol kinase family lipid kinase [Niabella terrae]